MVEHADSQFQPICLTNHFVLTKMAV